MNEPKPQTPLTDAAISGSRYVGMTNDVVLADFARSLELKLQEAERQRDEWRKSANYLNDQADKLKAERDHIATCLKESRKQSDWLMLARNSVVEAFVILPNVASYVFQVENNCRQLRKVCDDAEAVIQNLLAYQNGCPLSSWEEGWNNANILAGSMLHQINALPHVQERNKTK